MSAATRLGLNPAGFSLDRNLSLYTIPAAYLSAFIPHTIKVILLGKRFDNNNPRGSLQLSDKDTPWFKETIERLSAMHVNGMETLPIFFATVLAGNFARLPARTLSIYSLGFLGSRILYNWVYFAQRTSTGGNIRSVTYFAGIFSSFYILVKSANKVYDLL